MTSRLSRLSSIVLISIIATLVWYGQSEAFDEPSSKFSTRAAELLASAESDSFNRLWLYLDGNSFDPGAVRISDRARRRRARQDPVGLLINDRDYPIRESVLEKIRSSGVRIRRVSRWLKAVSVEATADQADVLAAMPEVRRIDPVRTLAASRRLDVVDALSEQFAPKPSVLDYGSSEFQNRFVNAAKLHDAGLSGAGVLIAMFDAGFAVNHPAFDNLSLIATYDFVNDDQTVDELGCPQDPSNLHQPYHGTLTLGAVGAYVPGTLIGVAYGADFALAKTEITCGGTEVQAEEDNWIAAAEWADAIGADIISSSLGYTEFSDGGSYTFSDLDGNTALITIAADIAASKNILVVNSAGNERLNSWGHIVAPADGDSVIAVGAVAADSTLAGFSSPGPTADGRIKPDVTTLGVGVRTVSHLGGYGAATGTSLSTPLVAAGAALALEHDPTITAQELRNLIRENAFGADPPDNNFGHGLFDAVTTADIVKSDLRDRFLVVTGTELFVNIETSGRSSEIPVLTAVGLPSWVQFADNGDGSASLTIRPQDPEEVVIPFSVLADVGYFVDTSQSIIEVLGSAPDAVYAGPNPFIDSVRIFVTPEAGQIQAIAIFNISGEIVWEKVNNFAVTADLLTETWNGRNSAGRPVASGVFVVLVKTDGQEYRIKLLKTH